MSEASPQHAPLVIPMLVHHEMLLHTLYTRYAELFPAQQEFWELLAVEELQHAGWLRRLLDRKAHGEVIVHATRFHLEAIRLSLGYLVDEIVRAGDPSLLSKTHAVTVALHLEQALIEKRFYEVFEARSPEADEIISYMASTAKDHIARVQGVWKQTRDLTAAE